MSVPIAIVITVWFSGCGGYAVWCGRRARAEHVTRYVAHVVMAVAMVAMAWWTPSHAIVVASAAGFAMVALLMALEAWVLQCWLAARHAAMAGLMTVMWVLMLPARDDEAMAGMPGMAGMAGMAAGTGGNRSEALDATLLAGAAALALVPLLAMVVRRMRPGRPGLGAGERWLEGAVSWGMALGAAAMALH